MATIFIFNYMYNNECLLSLSLYFSVDLKGNMINWFIKRKYSTPKNCDNLKYHLLIVNTLQLTEATLLKCTLLHLFDNL